MAMYYVFVFVLLQCIGETSFPLSFTFVYHVSHSALHLLARLVLPPWLVAHARGVVPRWILLRRRSCAPRGLRHCGVLVRARDRFCDPDALPAGPLRSRGS